jgi:XTP/dITP diphosphohydrolase
MEKRLIMKFILASKNLHKAKEMQSILGESFQLVTQDEAGLGDIEIIEDGSTFEENSIKKAITIMNASNMPSIADDSGLCVDALDGNPGVFTARFAGENATDDQNIAKLLKELDGVPFEKRTARFVCVIAVAIPQKPVVTYRGECKGFILLQKQGDNGFGYDPIFFVPEYQKSMAELDGAIKNSISHRFNALKELKSGIR